MTQTFIKYLGAILLASALFAGVIYLQGAPVAHASAPSGLPARVATTSQSTVGTSAVALFATSTCAARIITTGGQSLMLTFSDYAGQTPTGSFGAAIQAASTTVVYDSGQYGCGLVRGVSVASQLITLTETQ